MILTLTNAYPVLPPGTLTQGQEDTFAEAAGDRTLELPGVVVVQQLHTFTVEFDTFDAFETARQLTGWEPWTDRVLEAQCDLGGGYGPFPGILVNKPYIYEGILQISDRTEYCGFILSED